MKSLKLLHGGMVVTAWHRPLILISQRSRDRITLFLTTRGFVLALSRLELTSNRV